MQILGEPIFLGSYEYRRQALDAESVALTIRRALERVMAIRRAKEISVKHNQPIRSAGGLTCENH